MGSVTLGEFQLTKLIPFFLLVLFVRGDLVLNQHSIAAFAL